MKRTRPRKQYLLFGSTGYGLFMIDAFLGAVVWAFDRFVFYTARLSGRAVRALRRRRA